MDLQILKCTVGNLAFVICFIYHFYIESLLLNGFPDINQISVKQEWSLFLESIIKLWFKI